MSTPDAETALSSGPGGPSGPPSSVSRRPRVCLVSMFSLLCTRVCTCTRYSLTRRWRHPREPSTIPAPPRDDRDADWTPPAVVHPTATLVAVLAVSAYAGVTLKVRAGRRPEPPRASLLDRSARSSSPPRPITRLPRPSRPPSRPARPREDGSYLTRPTPRPPPLLSSRSQARHDALLRLIARRRGGFCAVAASVEYASARQTTENAKSAYDAAVREASEASAAVDAARARKQPPPKRLRFRARRFRSLRRRHRVRRGRRQGEQSDRQRRRRG